MTANDWTDLVLGGALLLNYYDVCTKPGVAYRSGFSSAPPSGSSWPKATGWVSSPVASASSVLSWPILAVGS